MTLSQVDGPSATAQAFCGSSAGPAPNWGGGWRDGGAVLVMVLAPVGLAVILTTAVVFGIVGWHIATGQPVALPRANPLPRSVVASWRAANADVLARLDAASNSRTAMANPDAATIPPPALHD